MASIIEVPSRIVRLDLSLNELTVLEHAGLKQFKHLRELNASLNRVSKWVWVYIVDLSFDQIIL